MNALSRLPITPPIASPLKQSEIAADEPHDRGDAIADEALDHDARGFPFSRKPP
jgi:hypothetical protein